MTTVGDLIQRALPLGSRPVTEGRSSASPRIRWPQSWCKFPVWPPDLFAVVALLVDRAAAYRRLADAPLAGDAPTDNFGVLNDVWRTSMDARARAWAWGLALDDRTARRESADAVRAGVGKKAEQQAILKADLAPLQDDWMALIAAADQLVCHNNDDHLPDWWAPAVRLLITADTACAGAGFHRPPGQAPNWLQFQVLDSFVTHAEVTTRGRAPSLTTITTAAVNSALCAVLPKTRTPSVGCTLRSLTHNLALLPSASQVEARWALPGQRPKSARQRQGEQAHPLNLLLIPYPFRVLASDFKPVASGEAELKTSGVGYYEIDQTWLKPGARHQPAERLADFVAELVEAAATELGTVHGVVFPEIALNAECFEAISERLKSKAERTGFEFIVAGCTEVPRLSADEPDVDPARSGRNVALYRSLAPDDPGRWGIFGGRDKHHRWKLNAGQVRRYGLGAQLPTVVQPDAGQRQTVNWWESIPLKRRVVEFYEVRAGTSMTVLICEDLARADPCQQVIRAIGPNLVIALLFDGPQLAGRWPGHYAGVLADDPGSSVLTLTSLGLIERAATGDHTHSRSVALFRDCLGDERLIQLPHGSHAVAIRLDATLKEEHSLDGRGDGENAYVWQLGEIIPISAPHGTEPWILG